MPEININFLAVVLAAVTNLVIGSLWYGPIFGKQWIALMGFTPESMNAMKAKMSVAKAMLGGLVVALIMSFVLAHDAFVWGDFFGSSVGPNLFAVQLAFWIWLGYVATTLAGGVLWEGKSWKLFVLNAAHSLVSLLAMSFVLTFLK